MIALECGRKTLGWLLGISVAGVLATGPAQAQQQRRSLFGGTQTAAPKADDNPAARYATVHPARSDQCPRRQGEGNSRQPHRPDRDRQQPGDHTPATL